MFFFKRIQRGREGYLFLTILFISFSTYNSYAVGPTYVGGVYTTNQRWTPDGSPYIIISDIVIKECATLHITTTRSDTTEAPVEIRFTPGTGLRLGSGTLYSKSYGVLIAEGKESSLKQKRKKTQ